MTEPRVLPKSILRCVALLLFFFAVARPIFSQESLRNSSRECAICHIRWVDANFSAANPQDKVMQSVLDRKAGSGDMCLSCHDGSVVDSRFKVWGTRHHSTDVAPPPSVKIPTDKFPLDDNGHMTCATCHTAHAVPNSSDIRTVIFLRQPNVNSSFCIFCHSEHAKKNEFQHPMGHADAAVPQNILEAGGKTSGDGHMIFCQTCHEPHGSQNVFMLVLPVAQLCVSCHKNKMPDPNSASGMPVHRAYHGFGPSPKSSDANAVVDPNANLDCVSCHRLHDAADKPLLAKKNENGSFCLECHKDKQGVRNSIHDPTTSKWGKKLGFVSGGLCVDCHPVHGLTEKANISKSIGSKESSPLCESCHRAGGLGKPAVSAHAGRILAKTPGHPLEKPVVSREKQIQCSTCHDIHQRKQDPLLLRLPRQDSSLCLACHSEMSAVLDTSHDLRISAPKICNIRHETAVESGACGGCHLEHQASSKTPQLPSMGNFGDSVCTNCHNQSENAAAPVPKYFDHPAITLMNRMLPQQPGYMPTFDDHGRLSPTGAIACLTCHEPHGTRLNSAANGKSSQLRMFLRPATDLNLCASCHGSEALWRYLYYHKKFRNISGG